MEDGGIKGIWQHLGSMYLLFLIVIVVLVVLNYTSLSIALDKTIQKAEKDGYLDYDTYRHYIELFKINTSHLTVDEVSPSFGMPVNKLGDPLKIKVSNIYELHVFGRTLNLKYSVRKDGINTGYYGTGY